MSLRKSYGALMDISDDLKVLLNRFYKAQAPKKREMKRVFQWKRYLDWKDLTTDEKLSVKRFLLIPIYAYLIVGIFNQNFSLIVLLLIGYVLYKKFERGGIQKK